MHKHLKGKENSEKREGREGKIDKKRESEAWEEGDPGSEEWIRRETEAKRKNDRGHKGRRLRWKYETNAIE